jgi:hypothetical protein
MKKILEKLWVFELSLRFFAFFAQINRLSFFTKFLTNISAHLNLWLNRPQKAANTKELAETWQALMPKDGQDLFKIKTVDIETAIAEIHLHCPLRGTGNVNACHRLMNYDRKLMQKIGGELIVLESQSNSGKSYCTLAIRKKGSDTSDLIHAHLKPIP